MPDEYTNAAVFGNSNIYPESETSSPEQWSNPISANTIAGLAARMATGQLTDSDDYARVMGTFGGTADDVTLHRGLVATTGGPEPAVPVTNPTKPVVAPEIADAPPPVQATAKTTPAS